MDALSLPHVELTFLAIRFLILIFSGHKHVALENLVTSWPSSHVRKSDHDCAIEIDGFGSR
jgi:hypothetical protein